MMPNINTLPPEVIVLILEGLPTSAALRAAILSCRHVYDSVKPYILSVLTSIITSQIDSLHYASNTLYIILQNIRPAPSPVRKLRDQSEFLMQTLVALRGVAHEYVRDFLMLELPLQQCDMQCASIALDILKYIMQPEKNSIQSWDDWQSVISRYRLTFRVALGKAGLQKSSVNSSVLRSYQRMVEEAKTDLEEEVDRPTLAGHSLQKIQNAVALEKKSIQRCLSLCNRALAFAEAEDFQVEEGHPTVISSITELLPKEVSSEMSSEKRMFDYLKGTS
ncbi:hypothetical protein BDV11DRAFT_199919 [Aspergillus similis]